MKTPFSSVVTPPPLPPKQCCKCFVDVYLFPTLKKGEGEATFHEGREENLHLAGIKVGNFHVSRRLLSMIVYENKSLRMKMLIVTIKYQKIKPNDIYNYYFSYFSLMMFIVNYSIFSSQVKGKIVVFNEKWISYEKSVVYRTLGAAATAKFGGLASLIRSITPFSIYSPHTGWQDYEEGTDLH